MSPWLLALAAGLIVALVQYGWRDLRAGWAVGAAALLRVGAITLLVALLLDAPSGRAQARRRLGRPRRFGEHGARRHDALARGARFDSSNLRRLRVCVWRLDAPRRQRVDDGASRPFIAAAANGRAVARCWPSVDGRDRRRARRPRSRARIARGIANHRRFAKRLEGSRARVHRRAASRRQR